jgi:two-component system, NtrC family, sensor kinase
VRDVRADRRSPDRARRRRELRLNAVRRQRPQLSEELRALLDALPIAAAIVGADGAVLHANDAMRARAGSGDPTPLPGANVVDLPAGRGVFLMPEAAPDPQIQRLASLGFMLAGVCHEVSNPLAAIHSMVQILQSRRGVTPETLEKGLATIAGNTVRVLAVTRKLGDFSRVTGAAPQPQPVDDAVHEALGLLRHNRWGEEIEVAYAGLADAVTAARPGELQQVLFNVMLNAAQAMAGRGHIEVATARLDDGRIRVRIRDTGPGIPEADLQRVFEPFFTTKVPGEGTGLGLAICNEIVHELGGSLAASNHPQGGTCLELVLPGAA